MAHCGAASRRKCEEFIKSGLVKVNDKIVTELGTKIDPNVDRVYLNGKRLTLENKKIYIILNMILFFLLGFVFHLKAHWGC